MATVEITYVGDLRTEPVHVKSGQQITTDAPLDNQGKGEAFSPTDLLATSLGSCMLTVMGIAARTHQIQMNGTTCSVTKIMAENPRRVAELQVSFNFPTTYTDKEKKILENAARTCPVHQSLHPDLKETIDFGW